MKTYVILRREGWRSAEDLERAAERSTEVGEQMPDDVRWIRSYVLEEANGTVGTVCIYEGNSPEAIRCQVNPLAGASIPSTHHTSPSHVQTAARRPSASRGHWPARNMTRSSRTGS